MMYPCAKCGASRRSLEAACDDCGWAPAPLTTPAPQRRRPAVPSPTSGTRRVSNWQIVVVIAAASPLLLLAFLAAGKIVSLKGSGTDHPTDMPVGAAMVEIYVEDSEVVGPGATVDIVTAQTPRQLVVGNVRVARVRWKLAGPFQAPTSPAQGFIAVPLTEDQMLDVQAAGSVSVFPAGEWGDE